MFPGKKIIMGAFLGLFLWAIPNLGLFATANDGFNKLLVPLGGALAARSSGDWAELRSELSRFDQEWRAAAPAFPGEYRENISQARSALEQAWGAAGPQPADPAAFGRGLAELVNQLERAAVAMDPAKHTRGAPSGAGLADLLAGTVSLQRVIDGQDPSAAREAYREFAVLWGANEGLVRSAQSDAYGKSELLMARIRLALSTDPPAFAAALRELKNLSDLLAPLAAARKAFGPLDAGFLIFREGLEALLVLAALLAFLRKSNLGRQQAWVWGGAGAGLAASFLLALGLGALFAGVTGGDAGVGREAIEGLVGLAAVALMLSVGVWLHGKANVMKWNASIKAQMNQALAGGSFLGLAGVAFLAVLREGAETLLFLSGLAAAMPVGEILLGVAGGLAVLAVLAVLILSFSVKLPIHAFFLSATILINYLCVKILGESLAALQAAGWLSAHESLVLPRIEWLGVYPNWEGLIPQLSLAVILTFTVVLTEQANARAKRAFAAAKASAATSAAPAAAGGSSAAARGAPVN